MVMKLRCYKGRVNRIQLVRSKEVKVTSFVLGLDGCVISKMRNLEARLYFGEKKEFSLGC